MQTRALQLMIYGRRTYIDDKKHLVYLPPGRGTGELYGEPNVQIWGLD